MLFVALKKNESIIIHQYIVDLLMLIDQFVLRNISIIDIQKKKLLIIVRNISIINSHKKPWNSPSFMAPLSRSLPASPRCMHPSGPPNTSPFGCLNSWGWWG